MNVADETSADRRPTQADRFLDEVQKAAFFQDIRTEGSFEWYLAYYRRRAPWRRRLFRVSGLWVIVVAVLLPLIAAFGHMLTEWATAKYGESLFFQYQLWLGAASASIALAGSLQAFFRWDVVWQGYLDTQRHLEHLRDRWQMTTALARTHPDAPEGLKIARLETSRFVEGVWRAVSNETKGFFSRISFPDPATPQSVEPDRRRAAKLHRPGETVQPDGLDLHV